MHASGRAAVLDGTHGREDAPWVTGRWGPSVVGLIADDPAPSLDELTRKASTVAGPGHWQSGRAGRAHLTVRALEPYADEDPGPDHLARWCAALERAFIAPLRFALDGLVLSPAGVMLRCRDLDGGADAARTSFGQELGDDGWLEDAVFETGRDPIWYCTLLHFAGPVVDPQALVEWVDARTDLALGEVRVDTLSVCRWNLDELGMAPTALAEVAVGAAEQ